MNVLMLSHYFPPMNLIGSKRMESLAEQIISAGHNLTVLKAANSFYGKNIDENNKWYKCKTIDVIPRKDNWYEWIIAYDICIYKLTCENQFDVCIISGGPFNYFLTAARVLKKLNIPYILDFRDVAAPIYAAPGYSCNVSRFKSILSFLKNYYIEYKSIKNSMYSVMTSESMYNMYKKRFPIFSDKYAIIYNGYDEKKLENFHRKEFSTDKISIGIFGKYSYYGKAYAQWLCNAIKNIKSRGIQVEILHIGERERWLDEYFSEYNCYKNIGIMDYLSGMEMISSQWILLVSHYMREAISTKIFDYIFLNHPIIGVFEKDSASGLQLSKFENGFVVYSEYELEESILNIWENKIVNLTTGNEKIEQYSRKAQNKKYIRLMQEIYTNKINS